MCHMMCLRSQLRRCSFIRTSDDTLKDKLSALSTQLPSQTVHSDAMPCRGVCLWILYIYTSIFLYRIYMIIRDRTSSWTEPFSNRMSRYNMEGSVWTPLQDQSVLRSSETTVTVVFRPCNVRCHVTVLVPPRSKKSSKTSL